MRVFGSETFPALPSKKRSSFGGRCYVTCPTSSPNVPFVCNLPSEAERRGRGIEEEICSAAAFERGASFGDGSSWL